MDDLDYPQLAKFYNEFIMIFPNAKHCLKQIRPKCKLKGMAHPSTTLSMGIKNPDRSGRDWVELLGVECRR